MFTTLVRAQLDVSKSIIQSLNWNLSKYYQASTFQLSYILSKIMSYKYWLLR